MARLEDIGEADGWRCWLCDEPVDPDMSVNDARGPSIDARITKSKAKSKSKTVLPERLAHRGCNTGKGAVAPEIAWAEELFVVDPAPIIASTERLMRKGGREVVARCPTREDAEQAGAWLVDRLSRLHPGSPASVTYEPGGGQFMLVLHMDKA